MGSKDIILPNALEGVDINKFTKPTYTINANETFEDNLKRLFGIDGKQAAEIVNAALAQGISITDPPSIEPPKPVGGKRRKLKGGSPLILSSIVGALLSSAGNALMGLVGHTANSITVVNSVAEQAPPNSLAYTTAVAWKNSVYENCARVSHIIPDKLFLENTPMVTGSTPVSMLERSNSIVQTELCVYSKSRFLEAKSKLTPEEEGWVNRLTPKYVVENVGGITGSELANLVNDGVITVEGKVQNPEQLVEYIWDKANEAVDDPELAAQYVDEMPVKTKRVLELGPGKNGGGKRRSKTKKRRAVRRRTYRN